jgi:hypothetical protein
MTRLNMDGHRQLPWSSVRQPFLALRAGAVGTRDPRRRVGERIRAERHSFFEL